MKRFFLAGGILVSGMAVLYAYRPIDQSSITGKVTPADQANAVWAISGTDSTSANVINGVFSLTAKAGTYKVIVDAKDPYKDVALEGIVVKDGGATDLGEIKLKK
jgi:hypothetical protein